MQSLFISSALFALVVLVLILNVRRARALDSWRSVEATVTSVVGRSSGLPLTAEGGSGSGTYEVKVRFPGPSGTQTATLHLDHAPRVEQIWIRFNTANPDEVIPEPSLLDQRWFQFLLLSILAVAGLVFIRSSSQ